MAGRSKISRYLSHEEEQAFVKMCLEHSAAITGEEIRELYLEEYGKSRGEPPSVQSCINWKNTAIEFELAEMRDRGRRAEQLTAIAQSGLELSEASAAALNGLIFDAIMQKGHRVQTDDGESIESYDLGDLKALSLSLSRMRLGDQRAQILEVKLKEAEGKLAIQDAKLAELEAQQQAARKKAEALQQALDPDTQLTAEEIRQRAVDAVDEILAPGRKKG